MANKSKHQLDHDFKVKTVNTAITHVAKLAKILIIAVGLVLGMQYVRDIAVAWAGKETRANISVTGEVKADVGFNKEHGGESPSDSLCFYAAIGGVFIGLLGMGIGRAQIRLRKNTVLHLAGSKEELEKVIDSRRSTSGLTKSGETRPEDE